MEPLGAAALILGLGVGTQWLAWRLRMPSILLLLVAGFVAGPLTGWIDPDALFGRMLEPLVAVSVAIIVFEGGLGLRFSELGAHGRAVVRLVTVGVAVTAAIGAVAAVWFLGLPWDLALLLGAIVTVSGPTVVLPLLRTVRPKKQIEAVLRWEGILIDPIGAILAVLVFEAISHAGPGGAGQVAVGLVATLGGGAAVGLLAAVLLVAVEARYWLPDHLQGAVGLGMVVAAYVGAELLLDEAGLMAVTVMGITLANQRRVDIGHIVDFKENLSQVLLGSLFVILAARIRLEDLANLELGVLAFVAALVFVARPLAVALSSYGTPLAMRDRAFMAWLAPRGIVAAAVSAFFGIRLEAAGRPEAALFVPVTFSVIVITVALYGLTARPLAKLLGVAGPAPEGVLFVGANRVTRELARVLDEQGIPTLIADTEIDAIVAAKTDGRQAILVDPMSMRFEDQVELASFGRMWAITPEASRNRLACVHFAPELGRAKVYHIDETPDNDDPRRRRIVGRILFREGLTYRSLRDRLAEGWTVRRTPITEVFDEEAWTAEHGAEAEPLWLITADRRLEVFTDDHHPAIEAGKTLVALVRPEPDEEE